MTRDLSYQDRLRRLAQAGIAAGVQLVRLTDLEQANRYTARPIEFDDDGATDFVGSESLTVTNLAEPADMTGQVPDDTDAVAVDIEGRWVVFVRRDPSASFPARIVSSSGSSLYTVREQVMTGSTTFQDKQGTSNVYAANLAEQTLGPGAAVDDDTIVLVKAILDDGDPPTTRYFFDHPAYAKYLD